MPIRNRALSTKSEKLIVGKHIIDVKNDLHDLGRIYSYTNLFSNLNEWRLYKITSNKNNEIKYFVFSFRENSEAFSRSFRDQPQSPLERAVFWVEYTIRHGSGLKLRSPGQDLGFVQQTALDVVLFYLGTIILLVVLLKLGAHRVSASFFVIKKVKTT